jgi:hypothetical protein
MRNHKIGGIFFALVASLILTTPVFAQYYPNTVVVNPAYGPVYGNPYYPPAYNNYCYRGYAPCYHYGYGYHHYRTARNMAIGAGIGAAAGAAVGLLASHHGHRYYY